VTGAAHGLRDPSTMTDAELIAEIRRLEAIEDRLAAESDPASMLRRLMPAYVIRPHLTVISREMARIAAGEIDRLLITVPPQTGKTLTAVVGGAVWWLSNHPTDRVIIGSYGDRLAIDRGRESKKLIKDQGSRIGLQVERGTEQDWQLITGGGVLSVGVGAGVTGRTGNIAFIDDPHKSREEADSLRMRDRVERWLSADIVSRLSPGAPMVMILTRWHEDDLAARVIAQEGTTDQGGRWRVIRMPALCDDPENDPIGRKTGAPLPHPKIPVRDVDAALRHWQDKRRGSGVRDWHALYQCDPHPEEGALLSRRLLRERRCFEDDPQRDGKPVKSAVAVDPSGGGRDTAGIVGGYLGSDKRLYITHDKTGLMPSSEWAKSACQLAYAIDADVVLFEANYGGDQALSLIRTAWDALRVAHREQARVELVTSEPRLSAHDVERSLDRAELPYSGLCPRIKSVRARKNKRLRADPVAQQWIEDRIRSGAYLPELEEEWATWQPDSTDSPGRIDASVYLAYELLPLPKASSGGARQQSQGSLPTTGTSPLDTGSGTSGFGPLG
jgi:hypothetical protein